MPPPSTEQRLSRYKPKLLGIWQPRSNQFLPEPCDRNKVDRVYLLDGYADEKREAWHKLGDSLETILSASNVVSLKSA